MMILAFIGGPHSAQETMAAQLAKDLKGCFRVEHVNNDANNWTPVEKCDRLRRALSKRKASDLVIIVTGITLQRELDFLRYRKATICIPHAPLHSLFDDNPITSADVFVCSRPGALDTPQKRKQYITPEEAFSACYSRLRGFKGVA